MSQPNWDSAAQAQPKHSNLFCCPMGRTEWRHLENLLSHIEPLYWASYIINCTLGFISKSKTNRLRDLLGCTWNISFVLAWQYSKGIHNLEKVQSDGYGAGAHDIQGEAEGNTVGSAGES